MTALLRARLQVLVAAVIFSMGGAAIKSCSLGAWHVAGLRSGVAALVLLAAVPQARGRWTARTFLVGTAYAGTMILYVAANKLTTAANAIFLQSTAPLFVCLLAPYVLAEPFRRRDLPFLGAVGCGILLLVFGIDESSATAPNPALGNAVAAVSGFVWACTLMLLRWTERRDPAGSAPGVVLGNVIASGVALPLSGSVPQGSSLDWALVFYLGAIQIGAAYACLIRGVRVLPALEVSLLLLLEPVLNPVWAWLVHGETPSAFSLTGGAIVLAATTLRGVLMPGADVAEPVNGRGGGEQVSPAEHHASVG
ncbi:MAG: DMT family transporter [Candidatus Schekmanbacteria bacterium]|nr:DMT family transporter [Candidatus Schekmanbacteria bacterium]